MATMALPVPNPLPSRISSPILRPRWRFTTAAAAARTPGVQPLPDDLQLVADVRSPHNHIRVADVSPRAAGHPLAGARLLDDPGNIHSLSFPRCARRCPLTATYLDAFATLPPLLPRRPRLRCRLHGPRAPPLPPGPLCARLGARPRRPGRRPRLLRPRRAQEGPRGAPVRARRRAELEKDHVAPELKGKGTREAEGLTTNSFWGLIWAEEGRRSRST